MEFGHQKMKERVMKKNTIEITALELTRKWNIKICKKMKVISVARLEQDVVGREK